MNLKERIINNDNRCTAQPYLLLLQEKRITRADPETHGAELKWVESVSGDYHTFDTKKEVINYLINDYFEDEEDLVLNENTHYESYYESYFWETVNVFFTDEGYQEHLKLNGHNLREHRTFGIHAFRNPEFKHVFDMIMREVK